MNICEQLYSISEDSTYLEANLCSVSFVEWDGGYCGRNWKPEYHQIVDLLLYHLEMSMEMSVGDGMLGMCDAS